MHPLVRRALMIVLALGALALVVYAAQSSSGGLDHSSEALPANILRLEPESGSEVLTQSTVGIEVTTGYDAYLNINGQTINEVARTAEADGLRKIPVNGLLIEYTPGPGRMVTKLKPGKNLITAYVYRVEDGAATATPFQWTFNAS